MVIFHSYVSLPKGNVYIIIYVDQLCVFSVYLNLLLYYDS